MENKRNKHCCPIEVENEIVRLFDTGMLATRIGKHIGKNSTSIKRILKRNNRIIKPIIKGYGHPCRKNKAVISGYNMIYQPEHPRAYKGNGKVAEHILILEKYIGRMITKKEPIHHIDIDRRNNEIDNLFLCGTNKEHMLIHGQLYDMAAELISKGIIEFVNGKYRICEGIYG